jgi:hypothetical protein
MLRKGARQVSGGDVCGGAASSRRGARALQQIVAQFERLVVTLQTAMPKDAPGEVNDLKRAGLRYRQGLIQDAADEAAAVRRGFEAACSSLGKPRVVTGIVTKLDAAKGLLQLGGSDT